MRIVIDARGLATNYEKRGIGYHIKNLVHGLPNIAPDVHFVFFLGNEESKRHVPKAQNVETVVIQRTWKYAWIEDMVKLPGEIKRAKADVFHCPVVLGPIRTVNIPWFSPVPIISTIQDLHVETLDDPHMMAYRREFRYKVQRWLVKKTNIITTSDYTRNVVAAKEICEKRKIKVIPICISDKWPMSTKKRENLVMFVGDAIHKNTTAAINVFKTLSERVRDWKYVMVGSKERIYSLGGLYAKELQASNILQIEENVPDEIFEAIFLKSKILFMPSLSEGFGVPVLQAFATGTCVLISDRGALPEVGGDAAVYVDPDNPAEMVSTLEGLMKNDSLQEALIEKGKKRVKKYFWQEHMKKLVKLYRQVAKHG